MHHDLGSWRSVGRLLDLPPATVHSYATTDWNPRRRDIRIKLGLDPEIQVTYIRQVRGSDGTFIGSNV
jgi:hypothetical protein